MENAPIGGEGCLSPRGGGSRRWRDSTRGFRISHSPPLPEGLSHFQQLLGPSLPGKEKISPPIPPKSLEISGAQGLSEERPVGLFGSRRFGFPIPPQCPPPLRGSGGKPLSNQGITFSYARLAGKCLAAGTISPPFPPGENRKVKWVFPSSAYRSARR